MAGLVHGLAILRLLALHRGGLSLSEIADRIKVGKTTVFRLLGTLVLTGYVSQDSRTKVYSIDYAVLEVAGLVLRGIEARSRAGPYLYELARRTGFSAVLGVLRDGASVVVDRVAPRTVRSHQSEIGFRVPAYAAGNGKVVLASLPPSELDAYLEQTRFHAFTERTIVDPAALHEHLAQVRKQGFAITDGEWIPGVRSVSAPIRNFNGDVIAGVGISSHDFLPQGLSKGIAEVVEHIPALLETADSISFSLGYLSANLV
ncbi:MAG: IclR family transcriptional regulator [Chloroflexi bacterium]|nr:IclR family transcriptional regulator [Chloroflexota bacterium]